MKGVSDDEEGPEWPIQHNRDMTRPRGREPLTQGIRDPVGIWEHISVTLFASGHTGLMANSQRGSTHKKKPPHLHLSHQMQMYMQIQTQRRILTSSLFSTHSVPSENLSLKSDSVFVCVCLCVCVCVCSMIFVHERVSNPSVGQRLYTAPWEFGGDHLHSLFHSGPHHVIRGILISCRGLQLFLPTLAWSIDVMFILLWAPLSHTQNTHTTAHVKSNNFQLLVGYRLQGGQGYNTWWSSH